MFNNMKVKRQPLDWEKIFANHAIDKGLVSLVVKYTNSSYSLISKKKKKKNPIKKW